MPTETKPPALLTNQEQATLAAIADRLFPRDDTAGASDLGLAAYLTARLQADLLPVLPELRAGLAAIEQAAGDRPDGFAGLGDQERDTLLAAQGEAAWFRTLAEAAAEGLYGDPGQGANPNAATWRMIGYDPRLPQELPRPEPIAGSKLADLADDIVDAIVIGAGAGGAIMACVLAEAGKGVLLIEAGGDLQGQTMARDHLRNQRLSALGHNAGPPAEGHPREIISPDGIRRILAPWQSGYQANASGLGGGTAVYGAQAWRFHPDDFRMASKYGIPSGSSLTDWPIGYAELEPFYTIAEQEIGVCGSAEGMVQPRSRPYPMPPVPGYASRKALLAGAAALGIGTCVPPLLINTQARSGRPACIECGTCPGFACPSDARNGTHNTALPRALATGRCRLLPGTTVTRIETNDRGSVTGVLAIDNASGMSRSLRARAVVVAAGAIETARLLLLSRSAREPNGLGNRNDLVGRNLQGHSYPTAYGLFDFPIYEPRGPGVSTASLEFVHDNPGVIGGAMMADDFIMMPAAFWKLAVPADVPRWGPAAKIFMRENYRRVAQIRGPVHEIPSAENRVRLSATVADRLGRPVAQLSGAIHAETVRTADFILGRCKAWLAASGAKRIWSRPLWTGLSAGQHQAGTCRMGDDPALSVTDAFGKVWGHENLFVSDAALHPTNGAFNPVLTIMALAFRNGRILAARL